MWVGWQAFVERAREKWKERKGEVGEKEGRREREGRKLKKEREERHRQAIDSFHTRNVLEKSSERGNTVEECESLAFFTSRAGS